MNQIIGIISVLVLLSIVVIPTTTTAYAQQQTPPPPVITPSPPMVANQSAIELIPTTVPLAQLQAEDSLFNNFTTIASDCVDQYADPAYNGTNPTPAPVCFQIMDEAIEKWCGLELYHADKCFIATRMHQAYVFLSTRMQ